MGEANRTANTSRQYIEWFLRTGCLLEKNVAGETLQKICPPADVACLPPGLVPKRCRLLERRCVSPGTWSPLARRQDCLLHSVGDNNERAVFVEGCQVFSAAKLSDYIRHIAGGCFVSVFLRNRFLKNRAWNLL